MLMHILISILKKCEEEKEDTIGISVENIGGIFVCIFTGIFLALISLVVEYFYYKDKAQNTNKVVDLRAKRKF